MAEGDLTNRHCEKALARFHAGELKRSAFMERTEVAASDESQPSLSRAGPLKVMALSG
jgi:hypothetical protein